MTRGDGQELFPLIDSWGARRPFPERFDHNGTLDITPWLTAPFAWEHIEATIGWSELRAQSRHLMDEASAVVGAALAEYVEDPIPGVGQQVGPMRTAPAPRRPGEQSRRGRRPGCPSGCHQHRLRLHQLRGQGYVRLSAHAYNSIHDYEYLARVGIPLLHRWSVEGMRGITAS